MPSIVDYDAIIVGGGLSGLLAAKEIASSDLTVKVLEEDSEIGLPERCDGLVSMKGLKELGVIPSRAAFRNEIRKAILHSPGGVKAEIDASKQGTVVIDRAHFDKELARQAANRGAEIDVAHHVDRIVEDEDFVKIEVAGHKTTSRVVIDARGSSGLVSLRRNGLLQAGKCLVVGDWFERHTVELYFDQEVSPGYFTWVIPVSDDMANVGVAGQIVNPFAILEKFIRKMGGTVLKRTAAPIYVGGPIEKFSSGRIVAVGDTAGQTKPSTAGGIYSGGIGGILAGKAISASLIKKNIDYLSSYEQAWRRIFDKEFNVMLKVRRLFEKMDNRQLDKIFRTMISSGVLEKISLEGDFDFHSVSFLKMLGLRRFLKIAKIISENEVKNILVLIKPSSNH